MMEDPQFKSLDIYDAVILDCVNRIRISRQFRKETLNDVLWAYIPIESISMLLPLLRYPNGTKWKPTEIRKRLAKLVKCGLLRERDGNQDADVFILFCGEVEPQIEPKLSKKRLAILDRDGHKCLKCGSTIALELDHVLPLSKGGNSKPCNLQTLCTKCNSEKRDTYADYRPVPVPFDQLYTIPTQP